MGTVIYISSAYDCYMTYFVQEVDEQKAKEKAYKMYRDTENSYLPESMEEAESTERVYIEVQAHIEQIIL